MLQGMPSLTGSGTYLAIRAAAVTMSVENASQPARAQRRAGLAGDRLATRSVSCGLAGERQQPLRSRQSTHRTRCCDRDFERLRGRGFALLVVCCCMIARHGCSCCFVLSSRRDKRRGYPDSAMRAARIVRVHQGTAECCRRPRAQAAAWTVGEACAVQTLLPTTGRGPSTLERSLRTGCGGCQLRRG
jgi:hypothetical protein